jgi:hypothetical protein
MNEDLIDAVVITDHPFMSTDPLAYAFVEVQHEGNTIRVAAVNGTGVQLVHGQGVDLKSIGSYCYSIERFECGQ